MVPLKTIEAIAVALGCFSEAKGKFRLVRILHTSDTGLTLFEPDLTRKPPPYGLAPMVPESTGQAAKEGALENDPFPHQGSQEHLTFLLKPQDASIASLIRVPVGNMTLSNWVNRL